MCLLTPCADPVQPGVWWRDDTQWRLYTPAQQQQIRAARANGLAAVDIGVIASAVYPAGARYTVNVQTMQQTNVGSGYSRQLRILDQPGGMPRAALGIPAPQQPVRRLPGGARGPTVHWCDSSNNYQQYDAATAQAVLQAAAAGTSSTTTSVIFSAAYPQGHVYSIYLDTMEQVNLETGRTRPIRIEFPQDPSSFLALALVAKSAETQRKLIHASLERFMDEGHLAKVLKSKISSRSMVSLRRNPYCKQGSPIYERFVDRVAATKLEETVFFSPDRDAAVEKSFERGSPLHVAFHGTSECNIEPILREGMAPHKRRHGADYFGNMAHVSLRYCRGQGYPDSGSPNHNTLLVFVLLLRQSALQSGPVGGVTIVTDTACQLPIAQLTLRGNLEAPPPATCRGLRCNPHAHPVYV
eukprot:jgi/Mesen1/8929/ME000548S08431